MKKLMIAASAAFCATVGFGEIASANIVGFADKATENFTFIGPVFTQVGGGEAFTFGDIKVNCDESGMGWQPLFDAIVMLDENGTYVRKLVYLPEYLASQLSEAGIVAQAGWYDESAASSYDFSDCWNDEGLTFGYGVQVSASAGVNAKATFSGEVKKTPTVTDVENFMSVANCSPVDVKLGEIVVNCSESGTGWQPLFDAVVMLDENGTFVRKLVYLPEYLASQLKEAGIEAQAGWYDESAASNYDFSDCWNDKVTYAPGEGFQVAASAGVGATVTIKSALPTVAE